MRVEQAGMNFLETPEQALLRESIAAVGARYGETYYRAKARAGEKTTELWDELARDGYLGVNLPEEYGGGGQGIYELAIICEELSFAGSPLLLLVVSPAISGTIIARYGTEGQKQRWLPGLAAGREKMVFAITEPNAGSNTHRLETRAERTDGGWRINGTKYYISGVDEAEHVLVVARTGTDEETGRGRLSLFAVPTDAPGFERQLLPVAAVACEKQFTLFLDDVEVPDDYLIGDEGDGLRQIFLGLNPERITGAASAVGAGRRAVRKAVEYANTRVVWKEPIGAHQGLAHPLAQAFVELELAKLMTQKAAWLYDQGLDAGEATNMANYAAAEAAIACLDQAIQIHGGNGLSEEFGLADMWWGVRLSRTAPVSREMILIAGNSIEFLVAYYALAKIGVVSVPINLLWGRDEVGYVVEHCRPKGAIVEPMFAPLLEGIPLELLQTPLRELAGGASATEPEVHVEDRDPLSYMYTSGTTSAPKGVVQSHLAVYIETLTAAAALNIDDEWCGLLFMPLFHTAALNAAAASAIQMGGRIVLMRTFDPGAVLETVERERVTYFFGLPIMLRAVLDAYDAAPRDLSSLRMVTYAMAPMPDDDLRRALETFKCDLGLGFGQTEMSPLTTVFRPEHQLVYPGSVGTQIPNVQTAIMDEAGSLLPPGQIGEIVYRSPQAMEAYLHEEDATRQAFAHGWFHSGDIGRFDEHGVLWFADRKKDVIKSGGENIASIEVERALYDAEPRIAECVVVGLPDERWGEAVTAIVTPKAGETLAEEEVLTAVRAKLPGFKVPKRVIFVEEMPHTPTGKVQKNVLRQQYARPRVEA